MAITLHKANERGHANHGRLDAYHSFSFGHYYNPEKMGFGTLHVINQDTIEGGYGFGSHPHDNMEIITIPLAGKLAHKDSTGKAETLGYGDIQVMSAGTGVVHSEYNASSSQAAHLLQIWISPHTLSVQPRHDSASFDLINTQNTRKLLVSDDGRNDSLMIHQHAFISRATLSGIQTLNYKKYLTNNDVYLFVVDGAITLSQYRLGASDALAITEQDSDNISITSDTNSRILLLEVPLT